MTYHPKCWHCRNPRAYWTTVAVLTLALLMSFFMSTTALLIWLAAMAPAASANYLAWRRWRQT